MVGSASYEFALPYDGELKKRLTVIGLEYSYVIFTLLLHFIMEMNG